MDSTHFFVEYCLTFFLFIFFTIASGSISHFQPLLMFGGLWSFCIRMDLFILSSMFSSKKFFFFFLSLITCFTLVSRNLHCLDAVLDATGTALVWMEHAPVMLDIMISQIVNFIWRMLLVLELSYVMYISSSSEICTGDFLNISYILPARADNGRLFFAICDLSKSFTEQLFKATQEGGFTYITSGTSSPGISYPDQEIKGNLLAFTKFYY